MSKWPPLLVVGLTGGIASGKSTIARMFAEQGAVVLNADDEGRAAVAPGEPALAEIAAAFGPGCLLPDGSLDRSAVARRIFSSRRDREQLNRVVHPRIAAQLTRRLSDLASRPPGERVVVLEAAVLIEGGWAPMVDLVLVVVTQPSVQVARLIAGSQPGLTEAEARARLRAQLTLRERLRFADRRISGEQPLEETRRAVAGLRSEFTALAAPTGAVDRGGR